jgi:hypothetical protein
MASSRVAEAACRRWTPARNRGPGQSARRGRAKRRRHAAQRHGARADRLLEAQHRVLHLRVLGPAAVPHAGGARPPGPTKAPQAGPRTRPRTRRARRETVWAAPSARRHGHRPPRTAEWRRDADGTALGTPCGEPEAVRVGVRCRTRGPGPRETQATPDVSRQLRTMYRAGGWKARVLAVRLFPRGLDVRWWCPIPRHGLAAREALRPSSSRRAAAGAIMPVPQDENR